MAAQVRPSDVKLPCSRREDETDSEIYYSVQEPDPSDDNESFYSVNERDDGEGDGTWTRRQSTANNDISECYFVSELDAAQVEVPEVADESQLVDDSEVSDFFNNDHRSKTLGSAVRIKKSDIGLKTPSLQPDRLHLPLVIEVKDESFKSEGVDAGETMDSVSARVIGFEKPDQRRGTETGQGDIEIIDLDNYPEATAQLTACENVTTVTGSEVSHARESFVEFDGIKRFIMIASDDETDAKSNDKPVQVEVTDSLCKRHWGSPSSEASSDDEVYQSPVQKKMQKLIELARKAESTGGT